MRSMILTSPRFGQRRFLAIVGIVTCLSVVAIAAVSVTPKAHAGTYLKGRSCSLYKNSNCYLGFQVGTPYQCYARFTATSAAPHPSHSAAIDALNGPAGVWADQPYWWTTAPSSYTPVFTCISPNSRLGGHQSTGSSRTFTYSLQLFSGGY